MKYDIDALKRSVLARYPFFGGVAAGIAYEETEDVRRTESDGRILFYNPSYLSGLMPDEQVFTLVHELCHIAFGHRERGRDKDPEIWRVATDAVINQMLKRDGLAIPAGGVDHAEAMDYDAEQYYELLLKEKLEIELSGGSIDEKDRSVSETAPEDGQQEDGGGDDELNEDSLSDDSMIMEEDSPDDDAGDRLREEEDEFSDDDDTVLRARIVSDAGNAVNRAVREVPEIGTCLPVLDWRAVLRDTFHYDVDWSFANAVLEDGVVRAVLEEQAMPETEIVVDTSWSVDEELLRRFLRECKNILLRSKLRAGCFDTVFYGFHEILTESDIDEMVFEGGGGTDFDVAAGAFTLRADNRIIFTDGKAPMPATPPEAIWMVYGDERIQPKNGTVIHIDPEKWV